MKRNLVLVREDCALDPKEIVSVMHDSLEGFDQYNNRKTMHSVTILLDSTNSPVMLGCEDEKEKIDLFNKIIELQGESLNE